MNPNSASFDCLTGGAFILSTEVQDTDFDGLLDKWETSTAGLDPNGEPLPDLKAMGALPNRKDLFVEINALKAVGITTYGTGADAIVDGEGHDHMPLKDEVLKKVADVFKKAPTPIQVHFDVGDIGQTSADDYIIPVLAGPGRGIHS